MLPRATRFPLALHVPLTASLLLSLRISQCPPNVSRSLSRTHVFTASYLRPHLTTCFTQPATAAHTAANPRDVWEPFQDPRAALVQAEVQQRKQKLKVRCLWSRSDHPSVVCRQSSAATHSPHIALAAPHHAHPRLPPCVFRRSWAKETPPS